MAPARVSSLFFHSLSGNSYSHKERRKKVKSLSRVRLFATPWTIAHQAPLSMGFSRQEYWSGLPVPSPSYSHRSPQKENWDLWLGRKTVEIFRQWLGYRKVFPDDTEGKICLPFQEMWVPSLGWEDPLEEEMVTHSYSLFLPGKSHGQRSLASYIFPMESCKSQIQLSEWNNHTTRLQEMGQKSSDPQVFLTWKSGKNRAFWACSHASEIHHARERPWRVWTSLNSTHPSLGVQGKSNSILTKSILVVVANNFKGEWDVVPICLFFFVLRRCQWLLLHWKWTYIRDYIILKHLQSDNKRSVDHFS